MHRQHRTSRPHRPPTTTAWTTPDPTRPDPQRPTERQPARRLGQREPQAALGQKTARASTDSSRDSIGGVGASSRPLPQRVIPVIRNVLLGRYSDACGSRNGCRPWSWQAGRQGSRASWGVSMSAAQHNRQVNNGHTHDSVNGQFCGTTPQRTASPTYWVGRRELSGNDFLGSAQEGLAVRRGWCRCDGGFRCRRRGRHLMVCRSGRPTVGPQQVQPHSDTPFGCPPPVPLGRQRMDSVSSVSTDFGSCSAPGSEHVAFWPMGHVEPLEDSLISRCDLATESTC